MFRKEQKSERTERREEEIQHREKRPANRFHIGKLEQRIAPHHGFGPAFGLHGDPPF